MRGYYINERMGAMNRKRAFYRLVCLLLAIVFIVSCGKGTADDISKPDGGSDEESADVSTIDDYKDKQGFDLTGKVYVSEGALKDLPASLKKVNITPAASNGKFITLDEAFVVETSGEIGVGELAKYIAFTPKVNYAITKLSAGKYILNPTKALSPGVVYRLTVGDKENPAYSFAFQTKASLNVRSFIPGNERSDVPVDTGIEVQFTESVFGNDFHKFITVSPATDGTFTLYPDGKTVAFVPKENLLYDKVYKVTVKKGITSSSGHALEEDVVITFKTQRYSTAGKNNPGIYYNSTYYHTSQYPVVYVYGAYDNNNITITTDIYKYKSVSDVIKAKKAFEDIKGDYDGNGDNYSYPTQKLTKVASFQKLSSDLPKEKYMELPKLDEGCYIADITLSWDDNGESKTVTRQYFFTVSDLIIYTECSNGSMLVWVNQNDTPVKGAKISGDAFVRKFIDNNPEGDTVYTPISGTTDENGVCVIDTKDANSAFLVVSYNGKETYACVATSPKYNQTDYFGYLYTDREVYFKNDTIHFAGIIRPAYSSTSLPDKLYVKNSYYNVVDEVTVNADGTFTYSYDLIALGSSYCYFRFEDKDGNPVLGKSIQVTSQSKPLYKAEMSFDKPFYIYGDTITVTLKASFYDGTPAPNLRFYISGTLGKYDYLTTDKNGIITFTAKTEDIPCGSRETTSPFSIFVSAYLEGEETTNLSVNASALYFFSDVYFTWKRVNSNYSEVYLNNADFSKLTADNATYENTIGGPAEGKVRVTLMKHEFKKRYSSTHYNPITKKTSIIYNYYTDTTTVKKYTADFSNGVVRLEHIVPEEDFSGYYEYIVEYTDNRYRKTYKYNIYALANKINYNYIYNQRPYYNLVSNKTAYSVGETVNVITEYDNKRLNQKILYTVYNEGRYLYSVSDGISFKYEDQFVAGLKVYATYIDEDYNYKSISPINIGYDYSKNSTLDVSVKTDKASYRPGENIAVTINAGSKAAGATAIISMVDEACFGIENQIINAISSYYASGWGNMAPVVRNYRWSDRDDLSTFSYLSRGLESPTLGYDDGYEEAPANGDPVDIKIREIFKNNPVFETATLDSKGSKTIAFTLPDNVTTWRITVIVFSNDNPDKYSGMRVGHAISGAIATLPYFITVSAGESYVTGDDIAVSARSYGVSLGDEQEIKYTATLYSDSDEVIKAISYTGVPGGYARFNFGKLEIGNYYITVTGVQGNYSDGVKVPVTVTDSGPVMKISKEITVEDIKNLNITGYPLILSFKNDTYDDFIKIVNTVMSGYSERSDTAAAGFVGKVALERLFGYKYDTSAEKQLIASYFNKYIPLVPYGEPDIELTAKIAAIAPELLTPVQIESYIGISASAISSKYYKTDAELCAIYLIRAALGDTVLADINYIAEHCEDFSAEAKLYLCAAFAYIGDFSAAREIYDALYKDFAKTTDNGGLYFKGENAEHSIKLTALALMSASLVAKTDAVKLAAYVAGNKSEYDQYILELASYVKFFMPTEVKPSSFAYRIGNGAETKVDLGTGRIYNLTLSKRDLEGLEITSCDSNVSIYACYTGTIEDATAGKASASDMYIEKTITPHNAEQGVYKVIISYYGRTNKKSEYFSLADFIPSGAKYHYMSSGGQWKNEGDIYTSAYISNSGQNIFGGISVWIDRNGEFNGDTYYEFSGEISYFIRSAIQGEFVCPPVVAVNTSSNTYALSKGFKVKILSDMWEIID